MENMFRAMDNDHGLEGWLVASRGMDDLKHGKENSPRHMAAINSKVTARHEAACIADKENSSASILAGQTEAVEHVIPGSRFSALRKLVQKRLNHFCRDVSRRVDPDAMLTPFRGKAAA
ncbi:hypothetical protein J3459_016424 [Metarhizium acridum]|nr:hypothetical protein J3459_016424 [Metarhizium acridum]